jgi:hypothetical protein
MDDRQLKIMVAGSTLMTIALLAGPGHQLRLRPFLAVRYCKAFFPSRSSQPRHAASSARWRRQCGSLAARHAGALLRQRHHVARAGDAVRPCAAEIGDQRLEVVRAERGIATRFVSKAIDRVMHARFDLAPEPPDFLAFEGLDRARQVVGRIPVVEFLPQRLGDD